MEGILLNTLRPRQNGRHFPDDIFKCILVNENVWISMKISVKFVPKSPINNIPASVQIIAWRRSGPNELSVLVAFVTGDTSTWSSVTLGSLSPFCWKSFIVSNVTCITFPRLSNYYINYLQNIQHLNLILQEICLIIWVLYVKLTCAQTSHWWLEFLCSETCA